VQRRVVGAERRVIGAERRVVGAERRVIGAGRRVIGAERRVIGLLRQCAAVALRDAALQRSYGVSVALGALSGALGLVGYHFIGRLVPADGSSALPPAGYFPFVCTGLMLHGMVAALLGALGGVLAREAAEGTLEPALASGAAPTALLAGGAVVPVGLALVQALVYAGAGSVLFDVAWSQAHLAVAALAIVATLVACAPIGLAGAALWLVLRRPGLVTTLTAFAFGLLGGVYFPVDLLPAPLRAIAGWVPLALGLEAFRGALLAGAGVVDCAPALLRLFLIAALTLPPSIWLLRRAWRSAREHGSLALV